MPAVNSTSKSKDFVLLAKHSAKVTPQHTLERVRNNQRRHRERRRDHIAILETRLSETRNEIRGLHYQIYLLKKDLDICQRGAKNPAQNEATTDVSIPSVNDTETYVHPGAQIIEPNDIPSFIPFTMLEVFDESGPDVMTTSLDRPVMSSLPNIVSDPDLVSTTTHPFNSSILSSSWSSACSQLRDGPVLDLQPTIPPTPNFQPGPYIKNMLARPHSDQPTTEVSTPFILQQKSLELPLTRSVSKCNSKPEINKHESTILCTQAYQIVSSQNYIRLSQRHVIDWLSAGFSWPSLIQNPHLDAIEGWADDYWGEECDNDDGCRVETKLLFGLLAFISDV